MNQTVIEKLKNDWLIQEVVINIIPVPSWAYFITVCSPFFKNNVIQFLILVQIAVTLCGVFGFFMRKQGAQKIVHMVKQDIMPAKEDISSAKIQAMHFPFRVALTVFIRWAVLANIFVFCPLLAMNKISGVDYALISMALVCAALSTLPSCFLLSENAVSSFLSDPDINKVIIKDNQKFQIRITEKIILLLTLCLLSIVGSFAVSTILAVRNNISLVDIKWGFILVIVQSFILTLLSGFLFARNIRLFMGEILAFFEAMANNEGDLNKRISIGSNDEFGDLATFFNKFLGGLRFVIKHIKTNSGNLDETAKQLSEVSFSMTEKARHSSESTHVVAAASEEMDINLSGISRTIEEATTNFHTSATATEEMASTIDDIAKGTRKTKEITENAVLYVQTVKSQVDELGRNVHGIGEMTEVISAISGQTHLLALNATIEAARAGEAGKGFTVVANEIKELSKQTADATKKITDMVNAIQSSSGKTIGQINEIASVIEEVNSFVTNITQDVDAQLKTTSGIAIMVSDNSAKNQEIQHNTSDLTVAVHDIVKHINQVNLDVDDLARESKNISNYGQDISNLSSQLMSLVSKFEV